MAHILRLLIIVLAHRCGGGSGEPLQQALQRRSDALVMYANDYAQEYEPVAFAALSLHAPMPMLHIVSQTPIAPVGLHPMASSLAHSYAPVPAPSNAILYARPDKYGGYTYTYRRRRGPKRPNKKRARPVLLRIHKYRVVRDR